MRTIRYNVFETNSSSEHCVTVSDELRTADEFPKLTDDGVLEIEAKINWECGQPGTVTDNVRDILDYLCMLAYCVHPWDVPSQTTKQLRDAAFNHVLYEAQCAYQNVGLEPPKSIYYYYTDINGNRYRYDGQADGIDKIWAIDGDGIIECIIDNQFDRFSKEDFEKYAKDNPDVIAKCIRTKYPFGINHNLCYGSFDNITFDEGYYGDEDYGIHDLLTKRFTLHFYRT